MCAGGGGCYKIGHVTAAVLMGHLWKELRERERKIGQVEVRTGREGERERSVPEHQVRQRRSERQAGSALC